MPTNNILKIRKVNALPGTYEASTLYMVKDTGDITSIFNIYVSNAEGTAVRHLISKSEITQMIADAIAAFNTVSIVANIAARNALTPTSNIEVMVLDATGDVTVTAGAATYIYDHANTTWIKISEYESMDVVLQWANISGKPSSTPANIDSAVSQMHTHANAAVLNLLSQDANGLLQYNGNPIYPWLSQEDW